MNAKEKFMMYVKIAQRAEGMNLYKGERITFLMDIEHADDANFTHDVVGIVANIDRSNPTDFNFFVPRFAGN